jgi:hypothetical protein
MTADTGLGGTRTNLTSGRTGFLTADQDIDAPIRMSRIVAEYEIVED